jgi:hypothetical protein
VIYEAVEFGGLARYAAALDIVRALTAVRKPP